MFDILSKQTIRDNTNLTKVSSASVCVDLKSRSPLRYAQIYDLMKYWGGNITGSHCAGLKVNILIRLRKFISDVSQMRADKRKQEWQQTKISNIAILPLNK